jgi:hypothetical protein
VEQQLWVAVAGESRLCREGALTFGRHAQLVVDESNQFLHRVVGRFVYREGLWWLQNLSRNGPLVVCDSHPGGSRLDLAAGDQFPTPHGQFTVAFEAGRARYELDCEAHHCWPDDNFGPPTDLSDSTLTFGLVPLSADQHLLCVAFAAHRLVGGDSVPTNAEAARALGWTMRKLTRKLDHVCDKLSVAGVTGLRGSIGDEANQRKQALVEHVVRHGLVAIDDLALLSTPLHPRFSSQPPVGEYHRGSRDPSRF